MRILNTLFHHEVYSGIHEVFKETCKHIGIEYVICDDPDHTYLRVHKFAFISNFRYRINKVGFKPAKEDIVITRSVFSTIQPFQFLASGRKFFISEESWGEKPIKRRFYSTVGKKLFKKIPFITQTPKSTKFLEGLGFRCFYIPPFIKPSFNLGKGKHILYVARMEEIKHPDLVVELARRMPEQKFVFIATLGKKDILDRIKSAVKSLPNVQFLERIPYDQVLQLYKNAKLLVLPTSADPIGYCVIEALSFAVPVITTKYAGTADYLDTAWVLDNFDPVAWENRVRNLLKNDKTELENRKLAKELFLKNNLELGGDYFKKIIDEVADYLGKIQNFK